MSVEKAEMREKDSIDVPVIYNIDNVLGYQLLHFKKSDRLVCFVFLVDNASSV